MLRHPKQASLQLPPWVPWLVAHSPSLPYAAHLDRTINFSDDTLSIAYQGVQNTALDDATLREQLTGGRTLDDATLSSVNEGVRFPLHPQCERVQQV